MGDCNLFVHARLRVCICVTVRVSVCVCLCACEYGVCVLKCDECAFLYACKRLGHS